MNREKALQNIGQQLARFVSEVEIYNAANQYNINIHSENFLIPVLNEVFDLKLQNINATEKKNYPSIDLVDFESRVAFQITSTSTIDKIKGTLETFSEYNLKDKFDILYIYILTNKQDRYSEESIKKVTPEGFQFNPQTHIIDKGDLFQKISSLTSLPKITLLEKLFLHEFSDIQIELRTKKYQKGYLNNTPENIFPNLLEISFPETFYIADINIDKETIIARINEERALQGKRTYRSIRTEKLIRGELWTSENYFHDWLLHENKLLTFRNLHDTKEPLRRFVDAGTITEISPFDFCSKGDDKVNVFKWLLRQNLIHLATTREMEWVHGQSILRFRKSRQYPNEKKIRWKANRKESTKTVIFKMINKKEGHVICYRHLAFKPAIYNFDDKWYISVTPTWSFTSPKSNRISRFESSYMTGIKQLENNATVYLAFRFLAHHLTKQELFSNQYPFLNINKPFSFKISPSIDDEKWLPIKAVQIPDPDLKPDNELTLYLFE